MHHKVLLCNQSIYLHFYFLFAQGRNRNGQIGYFPESYVQISASPPSTISGANSVPDNLSQDIVMATEITQNEHQTSKYILRTPNK
jgi:alpha-tubulin suppressor-like RCC1 family protein